MPGINKTNDPRVITIDRETTINRGTEKPDPTLLESNAGLAKANVVDIDGNDLLRDILAELRILRTHLELTTEHEINVKDTRKCI